MMTGRVNSKREAILRLTLYDANGQTHEHDTLVDTGYDGWLALPPDLIAALGLKWHRFGQGILADGTATTFNIYKGNVIWDGFSRNISIYEVDAAPLVGMSLMYGYELLLPILDGATFTLRLITNP